MLNVWFSQALVQRQHPLQIRPRLHHSVLGHPSAVDTHLYTLLSAGVACLGRARTAAYPHIFENKKIRSHSSRNVWPRLFLSVQARPRVLLCGMGLRTHSARTGPRPFELNRKAPTRRGHVMKCITCRNRGRSFAATSCILYSILRGRDQYSLTYFSYFTRGYNLSWHAIDQIHDFPLSHGKECNCCFSTIKQRALYIHVHVHTDST